MAMYQQLTKHKVLTQKQQTIFDCIDMDKLQKEFLEYMARPISLTTHRIVFGRVKSNE